MAVKKRTVKDGPFDITVTSVDFREPSPGDRNGIRDIFRNASPQGRIERLKKQAESLGFINADFIDEAEVLINDNGGVQNMEKFNCVMLKARILLERIAYEEQSESTSTAGAKLVNARHEKKRNVIAELTEIARGYYDEEWEISHSKMANLICESYEQGTYSHIEQVKGVKTPLRDSIKRMLYATGRDNLVKTGRPG